MKPLVKALVICGIIVAVMGMVWISRGWYADYQSESGSSLLDELRENR